MLFKLIYNKKAIILFIFVENYLVLIIVFTWRLKPMAKDSTTYFASPERSGAKEVNDSFEKLVHMDYIQNLLDSTPNFASILNHNRQIVFLNKSLLGFLKIKDFNKILGSRPGEAISCVHSADCNGGCGTSKYCRYCGAVQAIVESQEDNVQVTKECRIITKIDNEEISLDLSVTATPLNIDKQIFTTLIISDISDQKRKMALEKIFFHDVMNTATSIYGFMRFINQLDKINEIKEFMPRMENASNTLIEQINEQRELISAENGDLELNIEVLNTADIIRECAEFISKHSAADNKTIKIDDLIENIKIESCQITLKRVLINILKNALEASERNKTITIGCKAYNDKVSFWVHNETYIPEEIQLQIFQRSFSTKGKDRGLGTYSIKLLTNKYLKGKASFESVESEGTTFFIELNEVYPG